MAKRNVLGSTGLRNSYPFPSKLGKRLNGLAFCSNQGCPAACCNIDNLECLTIRLQVAIDGRPWPDVAKVDFPSEQRFDFRWPCSEDTLFDLYGFSDGFLKSPRGCGVQRCGVGDVGKIRDTDLV